GAALNHIGSPNFGAAAIPGVIISQSNGSTDVNEGGGTDAYAISLNTMPNGILTIQITADAALRISSDAGATFGSSRSLTFNNTVPKRLLVKDLDDNVVDTSPHSAFVHHAISSTLDAAHYPL